VASSNKGNPAGGKGNDALPFEEALKKLEDVVDAMENGDLPLEQLIRRFEEGTGLVKVCQGKLEEAELKVQQLEQKGGGDPVLKTVRLSDGEE